MIRCPFRALSCSTLYRVRRRGVPGFPSGTRGEGTPPTRPQKDGRKDWEFGERSLPLQSGAVAQAACSRRLTRKIRLTLPRNRRRTVPPTTEDTPEALPLFLMSRKAHEWNIAGGAVPLSPGQRLAASPQRTGKRLTYSGLHRGGSNRYRKTPYIYNVIHILPLSYTQACKQRLTLPANCLAPLGAPPLTANYSWKICLGSRHAERPGQDVRGDGATHTVY